MLVRTLLSAALPPDIHLQDERGETALQKAARIGSYRALKELHDAHLLTGTAGLVTPSLLWLAARHDQTVAVRYLLTVLPAACLGAVECEAGAYQGNCSAVTPLMNAAANGHSGVVDALLRHDPDRIITDGVCTEQQRSALHYAARYGNFWVVKRLVTAHRKLNAAYCVDPEDAYHGTPLQYAVPEYGHPFVAEYLLEQGANCEHFAAHHRSLIKVALGSSCKDPGPATGNALSNVLAHGAREGIFALHKKLLIGSA